MKGKSMFPNIKSMLILVVAIVMSLPARGADEGKVLEFPPASDGRLVLAVDLHTHSVFSDGSVWPDIRVEEAIRDGLAAYAVTEHLEWLPHLHDLPHPDRNRGYEVAAKIAGDDLIVIPGAEITRGMPIGHINAVFLEDANQLLWDGVPSATNDKELDERFKGTDAASLANGRQIVKEANDQGAFLFWNHPSWTGQSDDGLPHMSEFHRELIRDGLLQGIEVANGRMLSEQALQIALDHDLSILGTSDIHRLIAWDYEEDFNGISRGGPGHRTATLVLASERTGKAIRQALFDRKTVAIHSKALYGRGPEVAAVVAGALSLELGDPHERRGEPIQVVEAEISNDAPIPFVLRSVGEQGFYTNADIFTVPARSSITLHLTALADPERFDGLRVEVLNTYVAPRQHLVFDLEVAP
jgi:hypothetical protein